jgi:hypothetical protein
MAGDTVTVTVTRPARGGHHASGIMIVVVTVPVDWEGPGPCALSLSDQPEPERFRHGIQIAPSLAPCQCSYSNQIQ